MQTTARNEWPYDDPAQGDLIGDYPATTKSLAEKLDTQLYTTEWTSLTMATGWAQYTNYPPRVRVFNGMLFFGGLAVNATSAGSSLMAVATCTLAKNGSIDVPGSQVEKAPFIIAADRTMCRLQVLISGSNLKLSLASGGTYPAAGMWICLDSVPPIPITPPGTAMTDTGANRPDLEE